jgi:hypothetical protein
MACPHCGSWSVKADRSLAGRMVCGRCGRALGPAAQRSGPRRRGAVPGVARPWRWLLLLVAVSALLAWLAAPQPQRSPAPGLPQPAPTGRWR